MATWQKQPTKGIVKAIYQQQFYDWVTGVGTIPTIQNNNNSYYGLQTYLQLNGSLENIFSLEGETRFNMVGMARGLSSATTETHSPLVNIQIHHKPNQTVMPTTLAAYVTGANWFMKTVRDGGDATGVTTAGTSGNLVSEWNVASVIQSNSWNQPTAGRGHDISALVGIAQALGIGYRGGTQNSNALAYGLYVEAETLSIYGQGLNEIKVTNSSGTTAAHWYDTSYARKTVGLQIVADRDYSNGLGATGTSRNNAVGLWIRTANNADTNAAFYSGIAFEANSYSEVGIDFQFGGTSAFPILFGNNQAIAARNPAANANLKMFAVDGNGSLDLFYGTAGTSTAQDIQFVQQGGLVAAAVTPSGVWRVRDTTSVTAPFITVTNTGAATTAQNAVFSPGAPGQPNGAAVTDWLQVLKGTSVRYLEART